MGGHALVADNAFSPYGEVYNVLNSTNQNERMFTGLSQDILSGMWDTPNRELSSVGRWLSPDPAGAGWNQYAYTTNPNTLVDPSGLNPTGLNCHMCNFGGNDAKGSATNPEMGLFSSILTVGLAVDSYFQEITQGPGSAGGTVPADLYTGLNPDGTVDTSWMTAATGLSYTSDGTPIQPFASFNDLANSFGFINLLAVAGAIPPPCSAGIACGVVFPAGDVNGAAAMDSGLESIASSGFDIGEAEFDHVIDGHSFGGVDSAGKSLFLGDAQDVANLIQNSQTTWSVVQGNGNFAYVNFTNDAVGVLGGSTGSAGQFTNVYTVIVNPGGGLVTAFPGFPMQP